MEFFISQEVLALVPLTVGLVEVIKLTGLSERFAPLCSLFIGIGLSLFVMDTLSAVVLGGIAVGLMASGLYSGVRAMATTRPEVGTP